MRRRETRSRTRYRSAKACRSGGALFQSSPLALNPHTNRPYDDGLAAHAIKALDVWKSWHVEQSSSVAPAVKVFTLFYLSLVVAMSLTPRTSTIRDDITSDVSFYGQ
jgi:hypothetical protein